MTETSVRVRAFLGAHAGAVIAVAIVAVLLGGYLTYGTYVTPGEETERVQGPGWSSTGEFEHQATVTEDTTVFSQGDVLSDRGSYFTEIAPVLDGRFEYRYTVEPGVGPEGGSGGVDDTDLAASAELGLLIRSVEDDTEFWRVEEPLAAETADSLAPGETFAVPFSVDVTEVQTRVAEIDDELGASPGETEVRVVADLSLTGTRIGQPVDQRETYELGLDPGASLYQVTDDGPSTDSGSQTIERTVTASHGPLRTVGAPAVLVGGVLVGAGVWIAARRDVLSVPESDQAQLAYQSVAGEFDEWLTSGRIPDAAMDRPQVSVESLEGLVDVAIDSNRRAIEDRDRGYCAVLGDEATYLYEIPEPVVALGDAGEPSVDGNADSDPLGADSSGSGIGGTLVDQLRTTVGDGDDSDTPATADTEQIDPDGDGGGDDEPTDAPEEGSASDSGRPERGD